MPPSTEAIPVPVTRGRDAAEWLEAHGLVPVDPTVRSSDRDIITDPFAYYLVRRLGIVPFFSTSEALSRGSWFHACLEYALCPWNEARGLVQRRLNRRLDELRRGAEAFGLNPDPFLQSESTDCHCAMGWFAAACTIKITPERGTLLDVLAHYEVLGNEVLAVWDEGIGGKRNPSVAAFDKLLYQQKQNSLWIFDGKTCSENPKVRLQTCTVEFQSWHYLHILRALLDAGLVHKQFPQLPPDVRIGGIIHLAVQKPTINFGMNDRPYCWSVPLPTGRARADLTMRNPLTWTVTVTDVDAMVLNVKETFTSEAAAYAHLADLAEGVEPKKAYAGEPSLDWYIDRCAHWYRGTGPYESEATYRNANPPVNASYTTAQYVFSDDIAHEYELVCREIIDMARRPPIPSNFPRRSSSLLRFGKLSEYTPFYLNPPAHWPEIIQREHFVISPRDAKITLNVGLTPSPGAAT